MLAETFEELRIWQTARRLVKEIYGSFSDCSDFGYKDQIQRASVSAMSNIAEGFERRSRADFARFLDIAKGSSGEVRSLLYVAEDLNYLSLEQAQALRNEYLVLSKSIAKFTATLR